MMRPDQSQAQRGVTLVTALIFLLVISLVTISSMRASTMGVRMAQNEEARFTALQSAQALTEAIIAQPSATPVIGGDGFANCTAGQAGCNLYNIVLPEGWVADSVAEGSLSARVERLAPPEKPPPRLLESSVDKFSVASFRVTATYDRTDEGLGRTELTEGLLVLIVN